MTDDIESYLASKGFTVKRANDTNIHIACPFCKEDPSKRGRLYMLTEPPGPFMCHLCGMKGTLATIQRLYGDEPTDGSEWNDSYTIAGIWREAAEFYHDNLADHGNVVEWLKKDRGLTLETIQAHQIGWASGSLAAHLQGAGYKREDIAKTGLLTGGGNDFFYDQVTIPYHVNGNVRLIRGKQIGGKYKTPPKGKTLLFNVDVTWNASEIIVTEGELDALVLEQLGYAAVGVPGANVWQSSWDGYFSEAKKVFVVFDNDGAGQTGADKVALALGPKSRIVKMPEGDPKVDPTEYVAVQGHQKEDFDLLLQRSKSGALLTVWDAFAEWDEVRQISGLKLGFDRIDSAVRPGLLPWQVLIILAKTNVGKTIFTLNLFHRMCLKNPEMKILFVSLEQTRGEWFERARRIFRFYNLDATDRDCLDYFAPRLMMIDKNRLTEHELVANIEQFEEEMGQKPDLVAVDYLGYWARSYKGEGYERTTSAIMAMKALAKETRIAFLAPHQVNRMTNFGEEPEVDSGKESGAVEETADFVFTLWSPDQRKGKTVSDRTGEINLTIGKSRHGGVRVQEKLLFAPKSLAIVPFDDPRINQAKNEIKFDGMTFEEAIELHRTGKYGVGAGSYYSEA